MKKNILTWVMISLMACLFAASGAASAATDGSLSDNGQKNHKRPTVLLIIDGFGVSERNEHNAIALADTPVLDRLKKECPYAVGEASGLAVGLPEGQMGSSEVGHLNIGAGRIVDQELVRITKESENGTFFENESLLKAIQYVKELAKRHGLEKVYVHCFTDGRDTPPDSGKNYIHELQAEMDRIGCGRIATVGGRYYAMDRDNNWDRIEKAYRALTLGEGVKASSAAEAVAQSYEKGETDEFIQPTVVIQDGSPVARRHLL